MPQHTHSVELRQVQIKDHQVIVELAPHGARLFPVFHHVHRKVLPLQPLTHKPGQSRIILGNQNPHKRALITKRF